MVNILVLIRLWDFEEAPEKRTTLGLLKINALCFLSFNCLQIHRLPSSQPEAFLLFFLKRFEGS